VENAIAGRDAEGMIGADVSPGDWRGPASICEGLVGITGPACGEGGGIGGLGRGKRNGDDGPGGLSGRAGGRWTGDALARARGSNDSSSPSLTGRKPRRCSSMNLSRVCRQSEGIPKNIALSRIYVTNLILN
jgi:hypothetical protein